MIIKLTEWKFHSVKRFRSHIDISVMCVPAKQSLLPKASIVVYDTDGRQLATSGLLTFQNGKKIIRLEVPETKTIGTVALVAGGTSFLDYQIEE